MSTVYENKKLAKITIFLQTRFNNADGQARAKEI